MHEDEKKYGKKRNINEVLKGISASKKIPKSVYVLLLVLYAISTFYLIANSRSEAIISIFGNPVPATIFTGVFSSFANICIILLVVMFRRVGFFTSISLLILQFPMQWLRFLSAKHMQASRDFFPIL